MAAPFRAKVEERSRMLKDQKDSGTAEEPPSKKACSAFEKQMSKLPAGDLELVKDSLF